MSKPLKYTDTLIGFREVPNEVSLCINISNCPCRCDECHSPELQKDTGLPLNEESLDGIITYYTLNGLAPVTCICFMGDGGNLLAIGELIERCHNKGFLTCLYTGSNNVYEAIKCSNYSLDFIKVGPYLKEHGPLDNPNTNQKFYEIQYKGDTNGEERYLLNDLTFVFQLNDNKQHEN